MLSGTLGPPIPCSCGSALGCTSNGRSRFRCSRLLVCACATHGRNARCHDALRMSHSAPETTCTLPLSSSPAHATHLRGRTADWLLVIDAWPGGRGAVGRQVVRRRVDSRLLRCRKHACRHRLTIIACNAGRHTCATPCIKLPAVTPCLFSDETNCQLWPLA